MDFLLGLISKDLLLVLLYCWLTRVLETRQTKKEERNLLRLRLNALIEECNLNASQGIGNAKLPFILDGLKSFLYNTPSATKFPLLINSGIALLVKANLQNSCGSEGKCIKFKGEEITAISLKNEFSKYSELCKQSFYTLSDYDLIKELKSFNFSTYFKRKASV